MGEGSSFECSGQVVDVGAEEEPLWRNVLAVCCVGTGKCRASYHASENWSSSDDHGYKGQSDHDWWAGSRVLEDVVDLGLLAIALGFDGRHGLLGVAVERQLENRAIVGIGVAETTDDNVCINRAG